MTSTAGDPGGCNRSSRDDDDGRKDKCLAKSMQLDDDAVEGSKNNTTATEAASSVGSDSSQHIADLYRATQNTTTEAAASIRPDSSQHIADLSRATQNSLRDAVGAFHVEGINSNSRDNGTSNSNVDSNDGSPSEPSQSTPMTSLYSNGNLPPNIDIIAVATLVVENSASDSEEGDTDTLGLAWGDEPRLGGADESDTASVAISAITTPYIPTIPLTIQRQILTSAGDIESGDDEAVQTSSRENTDSVSTHAATAGELTGDHEDNNKKVYEATLVTDGPLAFLQTKSGRIAAGVSGILIILLSIGLAVGLTNNKGKNGSDTATDASTAVRVPTQEERDNGVLVFAADDFCRERDAHIFLPQEFVDEYPTTCVLGGVVHQAIADAQRRPHPFCEPLTEESPDYIPGESEPITEPTPHLCQRSNMAPDISLLNTGSVRGGEIFAGNPITNTTVENYMPFATSTIAYLKLTGEDLVKVLNNALVYVTQEDPWNIRHMGALPFASGLRYDVYFSGSVGEQVSNIEVLVTDINSPGNKIWVPIESSTQKYYWVVTNNWIAMGGDGYLNGIEPQYIAVTSLSYNDELMKYLENLAGNWIPPTPDEMSVKSFNA